MEQNNSNNPNNGNQQGNWNSWNNPDGSNAAYNDNSGNFGNSGNSGNFNNGGNGFGDQFSNNYNKLPADNGSMTLGIIGLVIAVVSCCCTLTSVISLVLNIIGLNGANKSLKLYNANPEKYNYATFKSVNNAKTVNIIGLVISAILTLFWIAYFIIYGFIVGPQLFEVIKEAQNKDYNSDDYEYSDDSWDEESGTHTDDEMYKYEEESDSLNIQTAPLENTPIEIQEEN